MRLALPFLLILGCSEPTSEYIEEQQVCRELRRIACKLGPDYVPVEERPRLVHCVRYGLPHGYVYRNCVGQPNRK